MNSKKINKYLAIFLSGILMPIFLLSGIAVEAAAPEQHISITFALPDSGAKNIPTDSEFMFGGSGLPYTYKAQVTVSDLLDMQNSGRYLYVEEDYNITASRITTNDPYFTTNKDDSDKQWYLTRIKMPQAWEHGTGSESVWVAIIDTGIHASHVELNDGRILGGYDMTTDKPISPNSDSDDNGHGTAVAGLIGAITNNKRGIAGVNWNVGIIPIKALQGNGTGKVSTVAESIVWAADNGADVINLSLGGSGYGNDQTLNNSIIYAHGKGSVIVSAAGNDLAEHGTNLDMSPVYPVCADGGANMVIGVAASDSDDLKADFSNYGKNCIDITAPGKRILTTAYIPSEPSNNVLIYGSGTSLAAPLVAAVAALLKANQPDLTNIQIKNIILNTTDKIDLVNQQGCLGGSCNGFLGSGRLNASSALEPQPLIDGTIVKDVGNGRIYLISGGEKREITDFVLKQRGYPTSVIVNEVDNQLANYKRGDPLPPIDGTLVKSPEDSTVYYVHQGVKRPLTYLVFQSRKFSFASVQLASRDDLDDILTGEWYWPPDGVLILIKDNPTVYVMEDGVKRPITNFVFNQRRYTFANVVRVTQEEFVHIPKAPDLFWQSPLDGSLIKSESSAIVYLIIDGAKRALTAEAFQSRNLQYGKVKTLPQTEIDVISTGLTLYN